MSYILCSGMWNIDLKKKNPTYLPYFFSMLRQSNNFFLGLSVCRSINREEGTGADWSLKIGWEKTKTKQTNKQKNLRTGRGNFRRTAWKGYNTLPCEIGLATCLAWGLAFILFDNLHELWFLLTMSITVVMLLENFQVPLTGYIHVVPV